MTKLTKNEKLLREGNEKWKKFLKEGAFAQQEETLEEGGTMGEYGKMDAEQGLPPTKIGRGNEEYMAAYNAVLQARGEEPLDMQQPDAAYLDALRSGQLEEQEKEADPRVVAMQQAMDLLEDLQFDSLESALDNMNTEVVRKLGIMLKQLDYNRNQVGNIQENEKKNFKVGEFVYIVGGSLKGASGKILEPVTTMKGEEGFAIELYSDAKMKVFGQRGDEVIATAEDLESGGTTDDMELYDIDEKLSPEDRAHYDSVMNKGKVPNLKGDMGPIPGLEGPFQYRSGAVLYYDPREGKYYDRSKDMYLDREEAAALTMEDRTTYSSDPEMDQIEDIAVMKSEFGLLSISKALKDEGFDVSLQNAVLTIDGKYFMGKEENFDISPDEEVRRIEGTKLVLGVIGQFILFISMKKAILLMLLSLGLSCSGSHHHSNPNTTLTADYYGIRENTSGGGYDNPRDAERLLLGNSRPLTIVFAAPWSKACKLLSEEISKLDMHEEVLLLDIADSTTQMLAVFVDANGSIPTMVHLDRKYGKIIKTDLISIIEFLTDLKNGTAKETIYE